MYVGAVLGTGVIALPALAAEAAGPASLLAWLALVIVSAPLAATFAALGARHPDAGGVSTYARLAFGDRAAAVVGWCFYFAIPPGAPAAALFGGAYVASAAGGGTTTTFITAAALIAVVTAANMAGLRLSGKLQLVLAALLVTLLLVSVALSLPDADWDNLTPFATHGWTAIGPAAALLVWSFAGWE
ncbi:amino acid permease, partial [Actinomadura soli]